MAVLFYGARLLAGWARFSPVVFRKSDLFSPTAMAKQESINNARFLPRDSSPVLCGMALLISVFLRRCFVKTAFHGMPANYCAS